MLNKKAKSARDISDIKKVNADLFELEKEIRKEAKAKQNRIVLSALETVDFEIPYKSVFIRELTPEQLNDVYEISLLIKKALLDAQELLRKGTEYGVQLALNRIETLLSDRRVAKSPFLIENYRKFESNVWNVIKLRELAYGEIARLKARQDEITRTALEEKDSMMRVRYFEDIRVLEKDILRLENEAHHYDTLQTALHSDTVLKGVLKQYATKKSDLPALEEFEAVVMKYEQNKGENK